MKIAIVSNIFKPYTFGGAEISTALLAKGLQRNGHEVVILSSSMEPARSKKESIDDLPVYRMATGLPYSVLDSANQPVLSKALWHSMDLWNPFVYSGMKKILQDERPDIVHTNVITGLSTAVWQAARKRTIPIVHTVRDYNLLCVRSNLMTRAGERCDERCMLCHSSGLWKHIMSRIPNAIVGISEYVLTIHREAGFFTQTPSIIIPNAIEDDIRVTVEQTTPSNDRPLEAIFLGRMEFAKGPQDALEALAQMPGLRVNLRLCGDGPMLNDLRERYKSDRRITFEGRVEGERKAALLRAADLMLVPSRWFEPFNRSIIEGYQYGLAVIGSRIGGIPEFVEDGITGHLFAPGDSHALAEILADLSAHRENLIKLRQRASNRVSKFLLPYHVRQYEAFYSGVVR